MLYTYKDNLFARHPYVSEPIHSRYRYQVYFSNWNESCDRYCYCYRSRYRARYCADLLKLTEMALVLLAHRSRDDPRRRVC